MKKNRTILSAVLVSGALFLSACGDDGGKTGSTTGSGASGDKMMDDKSKTGASGDKMMDDKSKTGATGK